MKKYLFTLAVVLMAVCSQALAQLTPMHRAGLAKNERLMGLYTSDAWNETGKAVSSRNASYKVFTILPKERYEDYLDGKITAIRLALSEPCEVKNVFVWGVTARDELVPISETSAQEQTMTAGWNVVTLSEPLAIPTNFERLAIGYEFVQRPGIQPISLVEGYDEESFCLIGDLGEGTNTYNYSQEGLLSVQAIVSFDNLPSIDVVLRDFTLSSRTLFPGSSLEYSYITYNRGTEEVKNYTVEVKLDGELIKTITEKEEPLDHYRSLHTEVLSLPEDYARGRHTLTLELTQVNGAAPAEGLSDDKLEDLFSYYQSTDIVPRQKYLIEEMTSHSCTACPFGAMVLEAMQEMCPDLAITCIHGNQTTKDPFNTPECQSLLGYAGATVFPSATFNRNYFGAKDGIVPEIGYTGQFEKYALEFLQKLEQNSLPAFASVDIEKALSEDGTMLSIKVSGKGGVEANELLKDYALTVYVLEDSLKYRQLNNGVWTTNYIHNHVLRKVATAINGDDIHWTSASTYENTFEVELGEKWVREHISIVAFLSKRQPLERPDWSDMSVSNANQVYLFENQGGGGDDEDEDDTRVDAGLRITPFMTSIQLMGEGLSPDAKYVVGQNYATSAPMMWNTEDSVFVNFTKYEEGALHSVNNSGTAVGTTLGYGGKALVCNADGTSYTLTDNGGTNTQGADAWCISQDGSIIGGFYFYFEWTNEAKGEGFYATFPCVWENKKCTTLSYPTKSEMGFNIDGAGLRWMSADGSVLLGYLIDDKATWPAIVWRRDAQGKYVCDPICKEFFGESLSSGKPYMMFSPYALSDNGEWVSLIVQQAFDDSNFSNPIPMARVARYNLRTHQLDVLDSGEQAMAASGIANDGTMLLYTNVDGIFGRQAYVWKAGETTYQCLDDKLGRVKGMPAFGANVPVMFGADGETILGFGIDQDTNIFSYVINLATMDQALDPSAIEAVGDDEMLRPENGTIYTIAGQQVSTMRKPGLYIVGGKKILVK